MHGVNTAPRLYFLDWLRAAAFGLLVLYHVGMVYVSWDWILKSPHAGRTIEPLMMLSAPWRLALLFLISGAAMSTLLAHRSHRFLRERSMRLLLPLALGVLVIVPPQAYVEVMHKLGYGGSFVADPNGLILAKAGQQEEVLVVTCDLGQVDVARTHWPFLRDRRIDSYSEITRRFIDD